MRDHLVIHNIIMYFKANHQVQILQEEQFGVRDHPFELIIGDPDIGVRTRSVTQNKCLYSIFLSKMEPKKIEKALTDPNWVVVMQERTQSI